ncbi:rab11 family-interacting protein 4A isoform X2 [Planococcus citri]|uniref:rab11 family-interacting protein 4A isoform X2 n=1 Tax=Planococcus citri TaxID=170843 RepID=UPI0031F7D6BB
MMAPNNTINERPEAHTQLLISISSEDEQTMPNTNQDLSDKTPNTNSQCSSMSDGESYECYGEGEIDSPPVNQLPRVEVSGVNNLSEIKRNSWLRTSLRRSTSKQNDNIAIRKWGSFRQPSGKRLGSNALASSSFNSSGRSSACDTTDDVYSDASLEEDVLDLNHKVQMLQQQMNVLADNQTHSDERYTRAKQENATLQARILILEEQLREVELRSEEKLVEEEKRHRELVARVDREKQLQVENCAIRLQTLELANTNLKEETSRYKNELELQRKEKERLKDHLEESQTIIASLKDELQTLREQEKRHREQKIIAEQLLEDLGREMETLRNDKISALTALQNCKEFPSQTETELQIQLDSLKQEHRNLQESYEEMQAMLLTRSIQEGRSLLTDSNNLAAELEEMTQDDHGALVNRKDKKEMKTALKEQQEVNAQLRAYIDNILLNIVENYPQLLEVKSSPL